MMISDAHVGASEHTHPARHGLPDEDDVAVGIGLLMSLSAERDTWVVIADPANPNVGPPAPARRCEARWTASELAGLADLQHVPAEAVDRELTPRLRMCPSNLPHVGEPVRIDGELDVVAGADAFAVPEHLSLIHISEPTRLKTRSRMPSSA